ncbi:MAG: hypothetical protein JWP01_1376 [Myxococcales bacterium]|nr:hypothetical protein [Myxococcales bacterium]
MPPRSRPRDLTTAPAAPCGRARSPAVRGGLPLRLNISSDRPPARARRDGRRPPPRSSGRRAPLTGRKPDGDTVGRRHQLGEPGDDVRDHQISIVRTRLEHPAHRQTPRTRATIAGRSPDRTVSDARPRRAGTEATPWDQAPIAPLSTKWTPAARISSIAASPSPGWRSTARQPSSITQTSNPSSLASSAVHFTQ